MTGYSISGSEGEALLSSNKKNHNKEKEKKKDTNNNGESSTMDDWNQKGVKCYRCRKIGHTKKTCYVRVKGAILVEKYGNDEEDWGKFFVAETNIVGAMASINLKMIGSLTPIVGIILPTMILSFLLFIIIKATILSSRRITLYIRCRNKAPS